MNIRYQALQFNRQKNFNTLNKIVLKQLKLHSLILYVGKNIFDLYTVKGGQRNIELVITKILFSFIRNFNF